MAQNRKIRTANTRMNKEYRGDKETDLLDIAVFAHTGCEIDTKQRQPNGLKTVKALEKMNHGVRLFI